MSRTVEPTIRDATGTPREGLRVDFYAPSPAASVHAITDAGGVLRADLEPGVTYSVPVMNAVIVNGQDLPAGTVLRIVVPEGEGPVEIADVTVAIIDASPPALLTMLETIQTALDALTARVAALEAPEVP